MATTSQVVTSSLPSAFETFYTQPETGLIAQAQKLYGTGTPTDFYNKYVAPLQTAGLYGAGRIAPLSAAQQQVGTQLSQMGTPYQFQAGTDAAQSGIYGLMGLMGQQAPNVYASNLTNYQMAPAQQVYGQQYAAPQMATARTSYSPQLNTFQMGSPGDVYSQSVGTPLMRAAQMGGPESFDAANAQQYMSPYTQSVIDVQKREAIRDAQKTQLANNLAAARQGTYGGSRQLLAATERERNLGTQLGDIEAKGMQSAYENAQAQFERDRAAGMQVGMANLNAAQQAEVQNQAAALQAQGLNAQQALQAALANQQARMNVGQQNLQAALGVQQLGTQTGLQTALANLSSEQQANVQNQAAMLQTQGLNADQALRAALANQQAGLTTGQQNLSALLGVQQLGSTQNLQAQQSNQSAYLQWLQQQQAAAMGLGSLGAQMGQLGVAQQASDIDRLKTLGAYGDLTRGLTQQQLDTRYQDIMQGIQYPESQLSNLSAFLRGIPLTDTTTTTTTPPPSFASQLAGMGLSGLSLYNLLGTK